MNFEVEVRHPDFGVVRTEVQYTFAPGNVTPGPLDTWEVVRVYGKASLKDVAAAAEPFVMHYLWGVIADSVSEM
jgi:hypothetical protein